MKLTETWGHPLDMKRKGHNSLIEGIGSVLSLSPTRRPALKVFINGRDVSKITSSEAMALDWALVGQGLYTAIQEADPDDRKPKQPRELSTR